MTEPPLLLAIQQSAKQVESQKAQRDREDKELAAEESAEIIKLDTSFTIEANDLKADMNALRIHATAIANEARRELDAKHSEELADLKKRQKREVDAAEAGKVSNLSRLQQTETQQNADLQKAQEEKKNAVRANFVNRKEKLSKKRQEQDIEEMRAWWRVLQDNSGSWASFDLSTQQAAGSNIPTPKGLPCHNSKRQLASTPPSKPIGWGSPWVGPADRNVEPSPNKRQRKASHVNTSAPRLPSGLPKNPPRPVPPSFEPPNTTIFQSVLQQDTTALQNSNSRNTTSRTLSPLKPTTTVSSPFNPPTAPRAQRPNSHLQIPRQSQHLKQPQRLKTQHSPQPSAVVLSAERIPGPRRYFPIKNIRCDLGKSQKLVWKAASLPPKFWLWYDPVSSAFKPDNGNPCESDYLGFVIHLKSIDRLEYNASKALLVVHRPEAKTSVDIEGKSLKAGVVSPVFIEFEDEDALVDFINLCKDSYWNIVLVQREEVFMVEAFKYHGWNELKVLGDKKQQRSLMSIA